MEQLPYIDEHATTVLADRAATWSALMHMWCEEAHDPATVRSPGFRLDEAQEERRFALRGRHLFSTYRLVFDLADDGPRRTRLTASTWAAFPGLRGTVYRALVIGSGGHRIVVRRMLRRIAAEAEKQESVAS